MSTATYRGRPVEVIEVRWFEDRYGVRYRAASLRFLDTNRPESWGATPGLGYIHLAEIAVQS
jgi:hypothetical protein